MLQEKQHNIPNRDNQNKCDTFSELEHCEDRLIIILFLVTNFFPSHKEESHLKNLNVPARKIQRMFEQIPHTLPFTRHHPNKKSFLRNFILSRPFYQHVSILDCAENKGSLCFGFPLNFTQWSNFYYNVTNLKIYFSFCSPLTS